MEIDQLVTLFRTHAYMRAVYDSLEKLPHRGHPYLISLHKPDSFFAFIGSSHTTDTTHPQWDIIRAEWAKFISSPNPNKIVFYEGRSNKPETSDEQEAIRRGADSGYIRWLAERDGIPAESPEPDRQAEIDQLVASGISEDDLIIYYVGRQLAQWHRYDKVDAPDITVYIARTLSYINKLTWSKPYDVDSFIDLFIAKYGVSPADVSLKLLSDISDPSVNPISSTCSAIRDRSIFTAIYNAHQSGTDIFAVFGSGHAIVMEPALKKLFNQK
jgi:hypothetical protein